MLNFFGVKGVRGVKGVKAKCHAAGRVSGAITPFNSFNSNKLKLAKVESFYLSRLFLFLVYQFATVALNIWSTMSSIIS